MTRKVSVSTLVSLLLAFGLQGHAFGQDAPMPPAPQDPSRQPPSAHATAAQPLPQEQRIKSIEFVGNRRFEDDVLRLSLRTKIGEVLDRTLLQEDVNTLYGLFDSVQLEEEPVADGVHIRFLVTENPIVRKVEYVGVDQVALREVQEVVSTSAGKPLADYRLANDVRRIRDVYRRKGYHFVEVTNRVEEMGGDKRVVFDVREGPEVEVDSISFVGNDSITEDRLRENMVTRDGGLLGLSSDEFVEETLRLDLLTLRQFYRAEGFLDATVELAGRPGFSQDREDVDITIAVHEGPGYRVGSVSITGSTSYPGGVGALMEVLHVENGRRRRARDVSRSIDALETAYREEGFFAVRVVPAETLPSVGHTVNLEFKVEEQSKVRVRRLDIRGNTITRDDVIVREISIYPDGILNQNEVDKSVRRLRSLQYFGRVAATVRDVPSTEDPNQKDVIFEVDDNVRTGQVRFAAGVSSDLGLIGSVTLTKRNFDWKDWPERLGDVFNGRAFTGGGQTFKLDLSPGSDFSSYRVAFTEPWMFDKPISFGWDLFLTKFNRFDYQVDRRGLNLSLGRRFRYPGKKVDTELSVSGTTRIEEHDVQDIDRDSSPTAFLSEGDLGLIAQRLGVRLDRLDSSVDPTSGWFGEFSTEFGFASDVQVWKNQVEARRYWVVHRDAEERDHVFTVGGLFAVAKEMSGSESVGNNLFDNEFVPIYERYRAGGSSSIRGFALGGAGPHGEGDPFLRRRNSEIGKPGRRRVRLGQTAASILENEGDPLGGDVLFTSTAEYQFPLYERMLRGVVFIDAGFARDDLDSSHGLDEGRVARLRRRLLNGNKRQKQLGRRLAFDDNNSLFSDLRVAVGFGIRIKIPGFGTQPIAVDIAVPISEEDGDETQILSFSVSRDF